ncbi:MAG TPA: hypothetical protein VNQ56_12810 [Pseudolabrys sp.]|nr:hypothetical protein [Pseudolabrys sp.]
MTWNATYSVGTISVADGDTALTGHGTGWALAGLDKQANLLFADGRVAIVASFEGDAAATLAQPWAGAALTEASYTLVHLPLDVVTTTKELRDFLAKLMGVGVIYYVVGDAPDPAVGEDGNFALKINASDGSGWHAWRRTGGVWVAEGAPAGIRWARQWSAEDDYAGNDIVAFAGKLYIARRANTDKQPDLNADDWDLFLTGGDRYDITMYDTDRPASGEQIVKWTAPADVVFSAGLADSIGQADVAATLSAVFSIRRALAGDPDNPVEFATMTFAPGDRVPTFAAADTVAFQRGDVLTVIAPFPRDPTLSGLAATIVGYRG